MIPVGTGLPFGGPSDSITTVPIPTDANFTPPALVGNALSLIVTSLVSLTGTRNLVLPLVAGNIYIVFNNTTGAQSIQVIGATGTGITIANAKRAIVQCDGTNFVRITADT